MARRRTTGGGAAEGAASAARSFASATVEAERTTAGTPPAGDMVLLGRISGAQGLKGEVRITTFTDAPENLAAYGPLTTPDGRLFRIEDLRPVKGAVVAARLAGIADRTAAEALRGVELYVSRECLPPPDEDEWYYDDLVGLAAISPEGAAIGEVIAVQNYGAGDLLEIRVSGERQTLLVPFTEAAVPQVDIAAGRVVVRLPEDVED
jgi:16S rRNA processing protein RimM